MNRMRVGQAAKLGGIIAGTAILIVLVWLATFATVASERTAAEVRIEAEVANQAAVFAAEVAADLLEVDETLHNLAQAWQADPDHFQLLAWRDNFRRLNAISPEVFIADEHGTKRDSTTPESVGSNIGDSDYFRALSERIFDDGRMFVSPTTISKPVREWHLNLARPLFHRDGSFAGVIVARLRTGSLDSFYRVANIGAHGTIGIVALDDGRLRFALGPNPIDPGSSIAGSDLFKAIHANPDGVWVGRTALDGIPRVHGFHRVADRDMAAVVAVDRSEAMEPTDRWARIAYLFAAGLSLLAMSVAALRLHAIRAMRRRQDALDHERAVLASANTELELANTRADETGMRFEATLAAMPDGVAIFDANMQLAGWNARFAETAGIPGDMPRIGLPFEDVVRAEAEAGLFGVLDADAEVARQAAVVRAGDIDILERRRLGERLVELRRKRLPDGGLLALYTEVPQRPGASHQMRDASATAGNGDEWIADIAPSIPVDEALCRGLPRTRILVAADGAAERQTIATALRREGHFVDVAGNGPEAISAAMHAPYDLVLMDLFMPGIDAVEATRRIRSLGGPSAEMPIIALADLASPDDRAACAQAGMNGLLEGPTSRRELLETIRHHAWPHRAMHLTFAHTEAPSEPIAPPVLSSARLEELRTAVPAEALANLVEERLSDLARLLGLLLEALARDAVDHAVDHARVMATMADECGLAALELRLRTLTEALQASRVSADALAEGLEAELFRGSAALREALHIEMV
jgi:CheY-like chemotaxis protein